MKSKTKIEKKPSNVVELSGDEVSLIMEALKNMEKKVREDMFYRREHPNAFYEIYLERYYRIMNKLDIRIPKAIFIKMPKF